MVVSDIAGLQPGQATLSLLTHPANGGILDDTVITQYEDYTYMVVNGATKHDDMKHFQEQIEAFDGDVNMEYLEDSMQLLAVQGPGAARVVQDLVGGTSKLDLSKMDFMHGTQAVLDGGIENCRVTRCV